MNRRKFLGLGVATVGVTGIAPFLKAKPTDTVPQPADDRGGHRGHAHYGSKPDHGEGCGCVRCCTHASDRVGPAMVQFGGAGRADRGSIVRKQHPSRRRDPPGRAQFWLRPGCRRSGSRDSVAAAFLRKGGR